MKLTRLDGQCPVCAMEDAVVMCECGANWCDCCGSGGDCWCEDEVEVK
jgi:hypothetical protein